MDLRWTVVRQGRRTTAPTVSWILRVSLAVLAVAETVTGRRRLAVSSLRVGRYIALDQSFTLLSRSSTFISAGVGGRDRRTRSTQGSPGTVRDD